jgi:excisionase family DNA binding protein
MNTSIQQFSFSPEQAAMLSGIGRTRIFKAINEGKLRAHKYGRRTVILADDLKAFLEALPEREVA